MMDIARAAVGIFATLAPFGLIPAYLAMSQDGDAEERTADRTLVFAVITAFGAMLTAVLLTDLFLGFLDVSPENFQGAAAVIMLPLAVRLLWAGRALGVSEASTSRPWLLPLAVPGLAGPASLAAVVAYSGRYGEADATVAVALALIVAGGVLFAGGALRRTLGVFPISVLGRFSGALIVAIALELAVDGIQSV